MPSNSSRPSPFNKREQHSRKRQAILSAAAELFNTKGPCATTLLDISSRLNLTKTSIYYYVKNKDELVYECYKDSCEQLSTLIQSTSENCEPGHFLPTLMCNFIDLTVDGRAGIKPTIAILAEMQSLKAEQSKDIIARYINLVTKMRDVLIAEEKGGFIRHMSPLATAHAFMSTLQWSVVWIDRVNPAEAKETAKDALINGLINPGMHLDEELHSFVRATKPYRFDRASENSLKQEAFIRTASSFFNKKGYHAVSLDEISQALDVTKGAFYYHIKNKEELLIGCFERTFDLLRLVLKNATTTGENGLYKIYITLMNLYAIENSDQGPLIRSGLLWAVSEKNRPAIMEKYQALSVQIGNMIIEGIEDKSIRPMNATITQELLVGAMFGGDEYGLWSPITNMQASASTYIRFFTRGLAPVTTNAQQE